MTQQSPQGQEAERSQARQTPQGGQGVAAGQGGPNPQQAQQPEPRDESLLPVGRRGGRIGRYVPARLRPSLPSLFGTDLVRRMDDPMSLARRLADEVDRTLGRAFLISRPSAAMAAFEEGLAFTPEVDVFERDGRLVVRADLPGMGKDDVQVEVAGDTLLLRGERKEEREEEREGYYCCERRYGAFTRSIPLPEGVDPDTAEASFRNGVLEVSLESPTEEAARRRRIEIKEEGAEAGRTGTV